MIDLDKKVVVITGGLGYLGQSFAEAIAGHNGIAIVADKNEAISELQNTTKISDLSDRTSIHYPLDITDKLSILTLIDSVSEKYGKIDALINNAYPRNQNYGRYFFEVDYQDFCENLNSHLGGYFLCSQQFALYFKKQGYGNIINIASIYGMIAPKFEIYEGTSMTMPVEYAAIKSALIHLTKYMAKYFMGMNIRVNSISPGGVSDQQPDSFLQNYNKFCTTKGMLDKEDLHGALLFLLSDLSLYVNGQNIAVDDGFTL
jgi:NAD(P)-dependent dehydrogenase (short-subunit alcohol dehydrogenase family)